MAPQRRWNATCVAALLAHCLPLELRRAQKTHTCLLDQRLHEDRLPTYSAGEAAF